MASANKSIRGTLKIAAIYAFALSTAVACSKFEVGGTKIGTVKGNVTAPASPALVAPTELTVTINKITPTTGMGADEMGQEYASLKIEMTHGTQPVIVDVYPQIAPFLVQDAASKTTGTVTYSGEGICGDDKCSKFGVMINVVDSSNGVDFQRLEIWDLAVSTTAPQKRLTQTAYNSITQAYESLAGVKLNQ